MPALRSAIALVALAVGQGCVTREISSSATILPPLPGAQPPAVGSASQVSVVVTPLCAPIYDGFTLPLVSPDGRHVAIQTGVAPPWSALLARADASRPAASGIEVWELRERDGRKVAQLPRGFILGRSCDAGGFLVEEVRPEGSRRIGKVAWPGAMRVRPDGAFETVDDVTPQWLVDDGRVNAFATLGADGALAWSVRDSAGGPMSLAVRSGEVAFEIPSSDDWNLILPSFSASGRTLFAVRVRDGVADLLAGSTADAEAFEQSLVVRRLSLRCDEPRAWQALAPQSGGAAAAPGDGERLLLFHPDLRRIVEWDAVADTLEPLDEDSFAAAATPGGLMLVADPDGVLAVRRGAGRGKPPRVYDRPAVPRRIAPIPSGAGGAAGARSGAAQPGGGDDGTWILLVPERDRLGVVRLRVLGA